MIGLKEQNELFTLLGEKLNKRIECYVIGGSAMLYYGTKSATKDIDIVFGNGDDREEIIKLLKDLGYKERETRLLYFRKKNVPILLQREDIRFDLFLKKVISFRLTKSIKNRIKFIYEFSNLVIKVFSPEDLIISKCATERAGDRLDAFEIIKNTKIDWNIIIDEGVYQSKITPYLLPVFLFDFLYELKEDLKADIPKDVINKIRNISEKIMVEKLKKDK